MTEKKQANQSVVENKLRKTSLGQNMGQEGGVGALFGFEKRLHKVLH